MMLEAMTALLSFGFRVSGFGSITGVGFRIKTDQGFGSIFGFRGPGSCMMSEAMAVLASLPRVISHSPSRSFQGSEFRLQDLRF
jgi:hypothetical protein